MADHAGGPGRVREREATQGSGLEKNFTFTLPYFSMLKSCSVPECHQKGKIIFHRRISIFEFPARLRLKHGIYMFINRITR